MHNLFIFFTYTFQQYPLKEHVILKNYKGKKQVTSVHNLFIFFTLTFQQSPLKKPTIHAPMLLAADIRNY